MGHISSYFSSCVASFSDAMAPDDKFLGFFVHFTTRDWHAIIINTLAHNVLSDSLAIILDKLFNLALDVFPRVI
jgi:hypothetical protein